MDIRAALTRKIGPLPAWAWGGILGGGILVWRFARGGGSGTGTIIEGGMIPDGFGGGGGGGGGSDNGATTTPVPFPVQPPPAIVPLPAPPAIIGDTILRPPTPDMSFVIPKPPTVPSPAVTAPAVTKAAVAASTVGATIATSGIVPTLQKAVTTATKPIVNVTGAKKTTTKPTTVPKTTSGTSSTTSLPTTSTKPVSGGGGAIYIR